MSRLSAAKRVEVCAHLVEQCSVRGTGRLCGVYKRTVTDLLVKLGLGCTRLHDRLVRGLPIWRIEVDELTAPVHTRQKNLPLDADPTWGHIWTYTAFATVSKLLVTFKHGKRTQDLTDEFMWDLRSRVTVIPELVSDGLVCYEAGVARSFGLACDYAQLVKTPSKKGKVSDVPFIRKRKVVGAPDMDRVSTSYVERHNSTVRDQNRRFARKTRCHSKKIENHAAQFALYAMWYNFVRIHDTIKTTPAVAAGIATAPWSLDELVEAAIGAEEAPPLEPTPLRPREGETRAARQLPGGGWLRVIDGGRTRPGLASAPGAPKLKREPAVKPAPPRPMKQMDLFDLS